MDDSKILELYWSRYEQAIAETRASYGVPLLTLANRILSSREDSEETVSDTYLRGPGRPSRRSGQRIFLPFCEEFAGIWPSTGWTGTGRPSEIRN